MQGERDGAFGCAEAWDCNGDHNDVPRVSEQIQATYSFASKPRCNNNNNSQTVCSPVDASFAPFSHPAHILAVELREESIW
jgi:hypothetical protein